VAQGHQARRKGLTRGCDIIPTHGLVRDRCDHGKCVLDAMLQFGGQQGLAPDRFLQPERARHSSVISREIDSRWDGLPSLPGIGDTWTSQ